MTGSDRTSTIPTAREVVSGVRRVWGTVRSSSHVCVKNTITMLAGVENVESIQVKRKYKSTSLGKAKWWYVIHAEEDTVLKPLEANWERIQLQTGWHLESCSKPVATDPSPHSNPDNACTGEASDDTFAPCRDAFDDTITPHSNETTIVPTPQSTPEVNTNTNERSLSESQHFLDISPQTPLTLP